MAATDDDVLFLIGKQLDFENEDGRMIEEGDGVMVVALSLEGRGKTFATLVWHNLHDGALQHLERSLGWTLWP